MSSTIEKKLKILMIGPFPRPITGQSLANKMLLDGFIEKGHDVEFVDSDTEKTFGDLKSQGQFNVKKIISSFKPILSGCFKIISKKYDVVYITPAQSYLGFMKYTPFITMSNLKKTKCYLHFHGGFVRKMYDGLDDNNKNKVKKYLNKSNGVIVLGNSLQNMFYGIVPKEKIFVCENGVQDEFILSKEEFEIKKNTISNSKKINILYLSNLMETKGILDLMQACINLKSKNFDFELNIAGNIEPAIEDKVNNLLNKLDNNVVYHGVIEGKIKRELLKKSDVFCLPTYYPNEGQPISILEAMGMGNAVLTTNQGGICDIFKDDYNGKLIKAKDSKNISDTIENIKSIDIYIENNYKEFLSKYTCEKFVDRIIKIIK